MARRGLSLSAKINSAVVLPILLAFIASGAAYIGIRQVSDEAQQVVGSGAALQAASELLVATERVGRLIGESGTQQEVAARLTPEVERMRAVGAAVAEAVQSLDEAVAEKLVADMRALDEVVRDSVIARANITDVVSLYPSAFAAFAEATTRLSLAVRVTGAQDAERTADEFSGAAGDIMQAIAAFAGSADNSGFEQARSTLSSFSDKIEAASSIVKAAGQSARALERAAEKERSKLYGLVGQQGASVDRLENVRKRMHDILERARSAARILKSDSETSAAAGLAGVSWWANALALGAMLSIALGIALAAVLHRFTKRVITVPLGELEAIMTRLARGDTQVRPQGTQRSDAIGAMARAVLVFRDAALEKLRLEGESAEQRRAAEDERRRNAEAQALAAQEQAAVVRALAQGLNQVAEGDLTYRLNEGFTDTYKQVRDDFNGAIAQLQDTIRAIATVTREVAGTAAEISSSTTDLSQRTEEQAASLEQTSASMEEIAATLKKNAENAQQANQFATGTREVADRGGTVVAQAVGAMARIEESSRRISDIISVIDEIARQTNMLALNAAVEAARAGEAGRGFAVVASEVRSLALRSSQAAKDIKDLITNSTEQVQEGVELVNRAGASLTEIVHSIKRVAEIVSEIASATSEQSIGIDQVSIALVQMDGVTQQNSALVEENAAATKALQQHSQAMDERVSFFRVEGATPAATAVVAFKRPVSAPRKTAGIR